MTKIEKILVPIVAFLLLACSTAAYGQGILPYVQGGFFSNSSGSPLALGKICTTVSGTSTNLATYPTYADAVAGTNANANPVVLDAFGRANIWLQGGTAYRIRIIAPGTGGTACNGDVTPTGADIKVIDGVTTGISVINALTINGVQMCDQYPGSTAGAKIAACFAALPTTGGVADACGIQGAQVIASDPFNGVTKPVVLKLCGATYVQSVPVTVPSNITLQMGQGALFSVNTGQTLTVNGPMDGSSLSEHFSGSGTVTLNNSTIYPQWFAGANAGLKLAAAVAASPATGAFIDARAIQGAQTISATISVTKPVTILLGPATFACSADPCILMLANYAQLWGIGPASYINKTSGTASAIDAGDSSTTARDMVVAHLKIATTTAMDWCVRARLAYNLTLDNVMGECRSTGGEGGFVINNSIDVDIRHMNLNAIGATSFGVLVENDSNAIVFTSGRIDCAANTGGTGIKLQNRGAVVSGTIMETCLNGMDVGGTGMTINAYFEDNEFGIIDSNVSQGLNITGSEFQASGIATWAIFLDQAIGATITGNNFEGTNTGGAPIRIDPAGGASNITIGNNAFDDSVEVSFASGKFTQNNIRLLSEEQHFWPTNYLQNTFQAWPSGNASTPLLWELNSGTVARRADAPFGEYSMDFVAAGSISRRAVPTISSTVNANMRGRWGVFSFWVRSISGATSGVLRMSLADGVTTTEADYTITTSWVQYSVGAQLGASATVINLTAQNLGAGTFAIAAPAFFIGTTTPRSGALDELNNGWPFLNVVSTAHTGTTAATDIFSRSIPGRTLGESGCLRAHATGTVTGTNDTKTVLITLNGAAATLAGLTETAGQQENWVLDALMCNVGSSSQVIEQFALEAATITQQSTGTSTENTDNAFTIALNVTLANAGDTVTVKSFWIRADNR
jgi:hypothetical protein